MNNVKTMVPRVGDPLNVDLLHEGPDLSARDDGEEDILSAGQPLQQLPGHLRQLGILGLRHQWTRYKNYN